MRELPATHFGSLGRPMVEELEGVEHCAGECVFRVFLYFVGYVCRFLATFIELIALRVSFA